MKKVFTLIAAAFICLAASAQDETPAFDIQVDDITWRDCHVVITPADPNMKFYYSSTTIEQVNSDPTIAGKIENMYLFDKAWWGSLGSDLLVEKFLGECVTGKQDYRTWSETGGTVFHWNSKGVVYCYGVNEKAEKCTDVYYKLVETPGPEPVDMTFDVKIEEMLQSSVKATVTPSTNDPYFVSIERTSFIQAYDDPDAMAYKLVSDYGDSYIFTGELRTRASQFPLKSKNQEYNFVIFGFKNGRTTPITTVKFRTLMSGYASKNSFAYYFLNDNGDGIDTDYMAPVEGQADTYTYLVEDGNEVAETWKAITGYPIPEGDEIKYKYSDTKEDVEYEINASKKAVNGYYGELTVDIYDIPFIKKILFVDESYATGIEKVEPAQPTRHTLYSIDGRQSGSSAKGVYLKDGKKFIK